MGKKYLQITYLIRELCLKTHLAHSLTLLSGICPPKVALFAGHSISLLSRLKKTNLFTVCYLQYLLPVLYLFVYYQAAPPSFLSVSPIWAETLCYTVPSVVSRAVAVIGVHWMLAKWINKSFMFHSSSSTCSFHIWFS